MERCCKDLGMGGSASRGCFVSQGGCRTWEKGIWWWLTGGDGKDSYGEGRRLQLAGARGPADGGTCVFWGWWQGRRWSVRGRGWRRFEMSWRVAGRQLARGPELAGKWDLRGGVWGGSVQASAQGEGRGNQFQLGWGELGLVFVGSDHPLTTFFRPGKVLNGVDSVFLISLLSFLSMLQCVPFRSPVMFLGPPV